MCAKELNSFQLDSSYLNRAETISERNEWKGGRKEKKKEEEKTKRGGDRKKKGFNKSTQGQRESGDIVHVPE